jgi:hypothetical protein
MTGAAFVGLDVREPVQVRAAMPERIVEAQTRVTSLAADITLVERGWHAQVPERRYEGRLAYRAPESLALAFEDRTAYPDDRWVPNDVDVVADGDTWWARGPAPSPAEALPGCADPTPRVQAVTGREPFRATTPAPLDLVVPVRSFALASEPEPLGTRTVGGRRAVGLAVTAAQVEPLIAGLRQAGTLRQVHPADPAELWLDEQALVPLRLLVRVGEGAERALWAARHGYPDEPGAPILELSFSGVSINDGVPDTAFAPPPADAPLRDAGFLDREALDVPEPGWLPDGMQTHRAGVTRGTGDAPTVAIATWSDGRAWLKVRATRDWAGGRLFGGLGDAVRPVALGGGTAYVGEGGRRVALHDAGRDIVVTGSLPETELLRVAASLDVTGRPVPAHWHEAGVVTLDRLAEEASGTLDGVLAPPELDGFAPAAARVTDDAVVVAVTGPGARSFVLTLAPGDALAPPLEPDVRGVEVRGTAGRYTPGNGELEWVEDGRIVSLRSATLSLDELAAIAERLERRP